MSRFVVVTDAPDFAHSVAYAAGGEVPTVASSPMPSELAEIIGRGVEAVIPVIDARADPDAALRLTAACTAAGMVVVLASDDPEQIGFAALKAGAADALSVWASAPELRASLMRADRILAERSAATPDMVAPAQQSSQGRVITVASPKGGVGKTSVATNLAVGLARRFPNAVVLVDLDVQFGDVATALGLSPQYNLVDATRGHAPADPLALKTMLTQHTSGLFVLPGSDSPGASDAVGAREVGVLLHTLAGSFPFVIVDTSPGLAEETLQALDRSTDLVLVTSLDVPGIRGLRKEIETLRQVDLMLPSHFVVLNFTDRHRGITVKDVEANIGEKVDVSLPVAKEMPMAMNQGVPLLQGKAKDAVSKQLQHLVDLVVGPDKSVESSGARATGGER
ncbi:MAG: AAA family ATPase [Propionibacterium sp.]|nr:AAA family ATPase [Propionibacterium sp.]